MKRALLLTAGFLLLSWRLFRWVRQQSRKRLYVHIEHDGTVKIGTCKRCVVHEKGRPVRAWTADGDAALDFPRDQLVKRLMESGLQVEIEQEYVCP